MPDTERTDSTEIQPDVHPQMMTAPSMGLFSPETDTMPSLSDWVCERPALKWGIICLLIVAALVSSLVLRPHYEDPTTWKSTVATIDAKKDNVLALTASSLALSAGISAIPDDTGTPIAEQLSQIAGNLGIVLAVLYLEKYMLTILSFLSLGILVPAACVLFIIALLMHDRFTTSRGMRIAGTRILVVALIAFFVVPASVWVTDRIDATYQVSVEQKTEEAKTSSSKKTSTSKSASGKKSKSKSSKKSPKKDKNILESLVSAATDLGTTVTSGLKSVTDDMLTKVRDLIEGVIVMIVTSCVIPILVLLVFLWLGHTLLGIDMAVPAGALASRLQRPLHKPVLKTSSSLKRVDNGE